MELIVHRGLCKKNNYDAFVKTINSSLYSGFECDVRTTKDNVFVINHDFIYKDKVIRKTDLKDLNLTTLKSVLNLKTKKIKLIEIKESDININQFVKLLNKYNDNIYVMSFNNKVIDKISKIKHNFKIGVLSYILNENKNYDFIVVPQILYKKEKYLAYKEIFLYGIDENNYVLENNLKYIVDVCE